MIERKVYHYGYGGWSELQDVRRVEDWRHIIILDRLMSDAQSKAHCTLIKTNLLAFQIPVIHPIQWAASDEGAAESADALKVILARFPLLSSSILLTKDRVVEKVRMSRLATV
jgi:hypothetical protein